MSRRRRSWKGKLASKEFGSADDFDPCGVCEQLVQHAFSQGIEELDELPCFLLADIKEDDCKTVEMAMTKCSTWCHDQAAAVRAPVPGSAELKQDIEALEAWVKGKRPPPLSITHNS